MRSRLALRTAGWVAGLTAALWMTAGGSAVAGTSVPPSSLSARSSLSAISSPNASSSPGAGSWTVYHGDPAGSGTAASAHRVDTASRAWTSAALDGEIYGEPLVSAGRVYVATENNTVYALSAATGAVAWSRHLATPVPSSSLPCGDIAPTVGITGTPVIDPARGEIFVVADEVAQGRPAHVLTGLSTTTGRVEMTRDVDPPGADPAALLQRTGLTLAGGRVVFGFGGNDGDCATYRGRVVAVPEAGGAPATFTVDAKAGQSQGAVWMGGAAPAVDARGDVWVSVGNGSVYQASRGYDDSDSALDLSPSMRLLQYFAPADWASENSRDLDMSAEPVLLPGGQVLRGRQVPHRLPAQRGSPRRHRRAAGLTRAVVRLRYRRRGRGDGQHRVPALCRRRDRGGPGRHVTARPAAAVAVRDRRRPAHRGRRAGLDDQPHRHPVRPGPADRPGAAAGHHRRGGESLPHPERRRRPAAGPGRQPGGRVPRGRGRGPYGRSGQHGSGCQTGPRRQPPRLARLAGRPRGTGACPAGPSRASWPAGWCCSAGRAGWCGGGPGPAPHDPCGAGVPS